MKSPCWLVIATLGCAPPRDGKPLDVVPDTDVVDPGAVDSGLETEDTDTDVDPTPVDPTDTSGTFVPLDTFDTSTLVDSGRDTAPPWSGPDTTSPTWGQVLSESGRCFTVTWRSTSLDVWVVGLDTGTVHHLARRLPFRGRPGGFGTAHHWDRQWLWLTTGGGVVRVDPLAGVVDRVAPSGVDGLAVDPSGADVQVAKGTFLAKVDVYDDVSALRAVTPSTSWTLATRHYENAAFGDGQVWLAWHSTDVIERQVPGGPLLQVPVPSFATWVDGLAADGGLLMLLDDGRWPGGAPGHRHLHVHDGVSGALVHRFDLGAVGFRGLGCVVD